MHIVHIPHMLYMLYCTLKTITNNPGYSNFEDYVDEEDPSDEMEGFDGQDASGYDQEYDSDEELVDLAAYEDDKTDSIGDENLATAAEAETARPN